MASLPSCFIIMPFGDPDDRYYNNVFAPAVVDAGLEPVRADSLFRSTSIIGDIWRLTREASVLLADLSGKNPNVFYELGLAHAIGKPVVLVTSDMADVPFDLRGLRVLLYDKDDEAWGTHLREAIVSALAETLNDLASAVPLPFIEPRKTERPTEDAVTHEFRRIWDEIRAIRSQQGIGVSVSSRPVYETPKPIADSALLNLVRQNTSFADTGEFNDETLGIVLAYLLTRRYIYAIKYLRETTGLGLKETKDNIDRIRDVLRKAGVVSEQ